MKKRKDPDPGDSKVTGPDPEHCFKLAMRIQIRMDLHLDFPLDLDPASVSGSGSSYLNVSVKGRN
jgi:hypothetical protein